MSEPQGARFPAIGVYQVDAQKAMQSIMNFADRLLASVAEVIEAKTLTPRPGKLLMKRLWEVFYTVKSLPDRRDVVHVR